MHDDTIRPTLGSAFPPFPPDFALSNDFRLSDLLVFSLLILGVIFYLVEDV